MIGYFKFNDHGVMKLGLFNKHDGNQFFSVQLFQVVEKMTDRNDPLYVVEKPQLRFVPELILDSFNTFAVDLTHPKEAIYVVHREFFEDESIVFRHGMYGIFSIANKIVDVDGNIVPCDKVDFPLSSLDVVLVGDVVEPAILLGIPTFLDIQFGLYQFRNQLAQHFVDALGGGLRKRNFRFDMFCSTQHFHALLLQKETPHVALSRPNRSHNSGQMLTHDSIFKVISPCTELTIEFESVDMLFNFLGSFFYFWPLTSSRNYTTGGFKDFQFLALDRFHTNLRFVWDSRSQRLRVSGKLNVITFDEAFGAESESERMIQALADRLCDDEPFLDEESGQKFVVVSVERNADPDLVIKGKPHLKFNGIVAWALPVDGSKWRTKLTTACKSDTIWRYRECVPMDPLDFDVIRHCIPFVPSETPSKKRIKKDPEDFSPEKSWKPSVSFSLRPPQTLLSPFLSFTFHLNYFFHHFIRWSSEISISFSD